MPLSPPEPREHIHSRDVELKGFRRTDGLWDVEARMRDVKTYSFPNRERGEIRAGEPIHDMWLRVTLDDDYTIRNIEAVTDSAPFHVCGEITPAFRKLIGLTLGPGWRLIDQIRMHETIVHQYVGRSNQLETLHSDEARIPRTRSHQINRSRLDAMNHDFRR